MRKLLAVATAAVLTLVAVPANAGSEWRLEECRFGGLVKGGWTQREVVLTIDCAVEKWPVPNAPNGNTPTQVAACESGLQADASNGGRYLGIFQHSAHYWPGRVDAFAPRTWDKPLGASALNARSNIVVSIRMVAGDGWGPWVQGNCA
jgi:hypothetical protein